MTTSKTHPIAEELFSSILGAYLSCCSSLSLFLSLSCKSVNLSWPAKPSPRLWARPSLDRVTGLKSISQATWRAGDANWLEKFHSVQDPSTPVVPEPPPNPLSHPSDAETSQAEQKLALADLFKLYTELFWQFPGWRGASSWSFLPSKRVRQLTTGNDANVVTQFYHNEQQGKIIISQVKKRYVESGF